MTVPSLSRMTLLWSGIVIVALCMGFGGRWMHDRYYDDAFAKATQDAQRANDAAVEHSLQVIDQADTLLRAVREFYLRTGSVEETERFIARLEIHSPLIEDIYLIDADGLIAIPAAQRQRGLNNSQRDHFLHHKHDREDHLHLTSVSRGQATGKEQFRVSRRLSAADGRFLGEVLIPLEPTDFSRRFQQLLTGTDTFASLSGTDDRLLRARSPEPQPEAWQTPLVSPLWEALAQADAGSYRNQSAVDRIERRAFYRKVGDLPLVMVTGFSDRDVQQQTLRQIFPLAIAAVATLIVIVVLGAALTLIHGQREMMRRLATTDALTGIANRRQLMSAGEAEFARARRYTQPFALLMLDIDHFKTINDTWGHPTGDRVLVALAETLREALRTQDVVGRFGGEEFLLVLPATDLTGAWALAERIRRHVDEAVSVSTERGEAIRFNVSIGVAALGEEEHFAQLLARADRALYAAKAGGRNRVEAA